MWLSLELETFRDEPKMSITTHSTSRQQRLLLGNKTSKKEIKGLLLTTTCCKSTLMYYQGEDSTACATFHLKSTMHSLHVQCKDYYSKPFNDFGFTILQRDEWVILTKWSKAIKRVWYIFVVKNKVRVHFSTVTKSVISPDTVISV